ncbi:FHA domain-containing protein [Evansella cellulosilytica]|uniref:Forkhead-associated protein n=1 Tax=Evansella cellulosilytica (strain ATCC 21833 / DSM 2522 / FERM P-1141 / JCM 9156 / N-4) TaxID=649639 RepID=E6TRG2_EVAC2|nr:FHA domain-containing protein [Evansella cellulosilytica]ADU31792.1 Forkhead-associated protein [Evansella cellulosilytica DSM 2522]
MTNSQGFKIEEYDLSKCLHYKLQDGEELIEKEVADLNKKHIHLLSCELFEGNGEVSLKYNTPTNTTLKDYFSEAPLTKEKISKSFLQLIDILHYIEGMNFAIKNVVLDENNIFIKQNDELQLIYLPIKNRVYSSKTLIEFCEELLAMHIWDENDASFFVKLHNFLFTIDKENPKLAFMKQWLADIVNVPLKKTIQMDRKENLEVNSNQFYRPGSIDLAIENDEKSVTELFASKNEKKKNHKLEIEEELQYKRITRTEVDRDLNILDSPNNIGSTSINISSPVRDRLNERERDEEDGTTVLGTHQESEEFGTTTLDGNTSVLRPFLCNSNTSERFTISKNTYGIGRDPNNADLTLNNKAIGRIHAKIFTYDSEYFLKDNGSKNGTYVNGERLQPLEKVKIKHEDKIKFANESFVFRLF